MSPPNTTQLKIKANDANDANPSNTTQLRNDANDAKDAKDANPPNTTLLRNKANDAKDANDTSPPSKEFKGPVLHCAEHKTFRFGCTDTHTHTHTNTHKETPNVLAQARTHTHTHTNDNILHAIISLGFLALTITSVCGQRGKSERPSLSSSDVIMLKDDVCIRSLLGLTGC